MENIEGTGFSGRACGLKGRRLTRHSSLVHRLWHFGLPGLSSYIDPLTFKLNDPMQPNAGSNVPAEPTSLGEHDSEGSLTALEKYLARETLLKG